MKASARPKLGRNVIVLSWVSFFQDAASEMLYPVLPLFLTGVLGAPVAVVGVIEGIAEGTASAMRLVSGKLADRFPRKPLIGGGYGLSSVSKIVIGFAMGWPLVLVSRFFDRVGKGMRGPPRDALMAAETPPELRGRAFGLHRAADTAGAVAGPLIGLGLYEMLNHKIRPLFFLAFIPAAASVALILFVREHRADPKDRTAIVKGPLPQRFHRVLIILTIFGLVNFSDALLILRAKSLGLSFAHVILVYALYNLAYALLSFPAGVLSDRIPRRLVFAGGLVFFAIGYIGLGLAHSSGWVWVLLPIYGGYTALTDGVGKAWVADLLPKSRLGTGIGIFAAAQGGAAVVAGVWAGFAWHRSGATPLIISGVVAAAVAVGLVLFGRFIDGDRTQALT
ncbi:MAG: MFS transporter [Actinomycetota bacterium]